MAPRAAIPMRGAESDVHSGLTDASRHFSLLQLALRFKREHSARRRGSFNPKRTEAWTSSSEDSATEDNDDDEECAPVRKARTPDHRPLHGHRRSRVTSSTRSDEKDDVEAKNILSSYGENEPHLFVHDMLRPEPLSVLSCLSDKDRRWLRKAIFYCIVRAGIYALITASVIGLVSVAAQLYFLRENVDVTQTLSGAMQTVVNWFHVIEGVQPSNTSDPGAPPSHFNSSAPTPAVASTSWVNQYGYDIVVLVATVVISIAEIVVLYIDNLNVCFSIARNCGVPLHRQGGRGGWGIDGMSAFLLPSTDESFMI
jgi:hypothetical protein